MTTNLAVPDLTLLVSGRQYGGQYVHEADLELHAHATDTGVELRLLDSVGAERYRLHLTAEQARNVHDALDRPGADLVPGVRGLRMEVTWTLGDERTWADLRQHHEELASWLSYATGRQAWLWDESDTWEF